MFCWTIKCYSQKEKRHLSLSLGNQKELRLVTAKIFDSTMETSLTGIGSKGSMYQKQIGNSLNEMSHYSPGKQLIHGNFIASVDESSNIFTQERDNNSSDMDISEDSPNETRAIARKDSTFSVPVIRVEDWSSSESDMEDDFDECLPPFCFVGTREKGTTEPGKTRQRSCSLKNKGQTISNHVR